MRSLLRKLKTQADEIDSHRAKGQRSAEKSHLLEIVGKYGMSQADIAGTCARAFVVAIKSSADAGWGCSSHRVEARRPLAILASLVHEWLRDSCRGCCQHCMD